MALIQKSLNSRKKKKRKMKKYLLIYLWIKNIVVAAFSEI